MLKLFWVRRSAPPPPWVFDSGRYNASCKKVWAHILCHSCQWVNIDATDVNLWFEVTRTLLCERGKLCPSCRFWDDYKCHKIFHYHKSQTFLFRFQKDSILGWKHSFLHLSTLRPKPLVSKTVKFGKYLVIYMKIRKIAHNNETYMYVQPSKGDHINDSKLNLLPAVTLQYI